jgi:two-component system, NtrC family, response regulator AtoC
VLHWLNDDNGSSVSKQQRVIRDRASTLRNTPVVTPGQVDQGLIVIVNGVVSTHALPAAGSVTIGRARENDIQIIDPSVSRAHARVYLTSPVTIEDLGSANGTRVRGDAVAQHQRVELPVGESIELGSAIVMLQRRPMPTREWRIWAHGYFEGRLEDECARATRSSSSFALVRLKVAPEERPEVLQQVLANTLRADDVVGVYGPGDYEALLVERSEAEAETVRALLEASFTDVGLPVQMAMVMFPRDGRTADRLVAKAGAVLRGESAAQTGPLVVRSAAMRRLYDLVERVAHGDISVLILGDTGVGKELMAEQVHRTSPRAGKPFLRLNCAALSESLLESELFGHERGSFTGAHQAKTGLLETAQGGTVFLDEIGELPMAMQVKLLRVLEERQVWRVGSVKSRPIDVRFVAATNRNLDSEIARGAFRQDLFFRLNGVTLTIPALRERVEEIEDLAAQFIEHFAKQLGRRSPPELGPDVLELMLNYSWPGNIRELRNAIERAVLLSGTGPILREHFPVEKMTATVSTPLSQAPMPNFSGAGVAGPARELSANATLVPPTDGVVDTATLGERLRRQVKEVERQHIIDALTRCGGNQTRAAKELGISRRTLISRLEEYNIPRPLKDRRLE